MSSTLVSESLRRQRERLGDLEVYPEPRKTDEALWEFDTQQAMERTQSMIDSLGEAQPILRTMLENAKQEIYESNIDPANPDNTYYGRRLMQRVEYNTRVTDVLITHEIMSFYGKGGIPGVTSGSCEALCAATKFDDDAKRTDRCNAFAFKRAAPFSYTDRSGWCYLLRNAGACRVEDFGVELFTRQIPSERQCDATAPGLDNPLCIGLPATRSDARVLSQVDAAAAAFEVPYDRHPAPGSRGLPLPRSIVEAMSFMAFARQQGVMSFWGRSPAVPDDKDFVVLHWPTEDGEQLKFRKNEVRCVLITSSTGPRMHMYAHLRPCESKEASGLLTVAAAAAPPPPPGDKTVHYYDPLRVSRQRV